MEAEPSRYQSLKDVPIAPGNGQSQTRGSKSPELPDPKQTRKYMRKIKRSHAKALNLLKNEALWTRVEPRDPSETVSLYTGPTDDAGFHYLRACGAIRAQAQHVIELNSDPRYETRRKWEDPELTNIEPLQSYSHAQMGSAQLVRSLVSAPAWALGVWDRELLGVQWVHCAMGVHTLVFTTVTHPDYPCDPTQRVAATGLTYVMARECDPLPREPNVPRCYVEMLVHINPGGALPARLVNWFCESLRQRMHLFERVSQNWADYYGTGDKKDIE